VNRLPTLPLLLGLLAFSLLSVWLNLHTGPLSLSILDALQHPQTLDARILLELRLPRAANAFVTGALLGVAGALMQVLLRNPLADPYILGVSGGASVGALLAISAGTGVLALHSAAFAGALLSMLLVFSLAHGRGSWDTTRLLLTGVVLAAGWGAVISLMLSLSANTQLQGMLFWLLGDLGFAQTSLLGVLALLLVAPAALMIAPALNLLASGELQAASLGVEVSRLRVLVYLLASLATASAVTQAGNIGFIGLVAPHMLCLAGARDYRVLVPAVLLLGGTLLSLADTLSRLLVEPRQLPVGVLTAVLGVPLFLFLLYRARQLHYE
jgi:iron complex transport system permease protein